MLLTIRSKYVVVALATLLLALAYLPSVSAEGPPFIIEWIDKTLPDVEVTVTVTASGKQYNYKGIVGDNQIKISEIDGVPQNSCRIEHPLLCLSSNLQYVYAMGIRIGEQIKNFKYAPPVSFPLGQITTGTVNWVLLSQLRMNVPYTGEPIYVFHIYLDASTAGNEEKALCAVASLAYMLKIKLVNLGLPEKAEDIIYLSWQLILSDYGKIYSKDANNDGSLDIWIPTDSYNVECATSHYYIYIATQYNYWIAGHDTLMLGAR